MAWIFLTLFMLISIASFTQSRRLQERKITFPSWVSDKGYWIVESSHASPLDHVISFYNNANTLVYAEKVSGVKLNADKKRVKMKLKKILETAVLAYEKNKDKTRPVDMALVSSVFK